MATLTRYLPSIGELAKRGWKIIYNGDPADRTTVAIRSVIDKWGELTWAKQTYYRAKYGFNENGVLDIKLPLVKVHPGMNIGCFCRSPELGEFVTPDVSLPSSNNRLQAILEQSRIAVHPNRYDDTALMHVGPDNTLILTNAAGWGLPLTEPNGYAELDDGYNCHWEISSATWRPYVPRWANPELQR